MARKKAAPQPDSIDVAALAQQGPTAEEQSAEAVPAALETTEEDGVLTLTETAAPVAAVVTRGVPKPPTPGLKVQLKNRKTGRIVAMSVNKELALVLASKNPNLEIL